VTTAAALARELTAFLKTVQRKGFRRGGLYGAFLILLASTLFTAAVVQTDGFERLNCMTSGSVTLQKQGDAHFIVFGDDFSTPNRPDPVVYLTANSEPTTLGGRPPRELSSPS